MTLVATRTGASATSVEMIPASTTLWIEPSVKKGGQGDIAIPANNLAPVTLVETLDTAVLIVRGGKV